MISIRRKTTIVPGGFSRTTQVSWPKGLDFRRLWDQPFPDGVKRRLGPVYFGQIWEEQPVLPLNTHLPWFIIDIGD
jgi:hypothetical protein